MNDFDNYSDNGAHNMTAEERAQGIEGVLPKDLGQDLPHRRTNNSNNKGTANV